MDIISAPRRKRKRGCVILKMSLYFGRADLGLARQLLFIEVWFKFFGRELFFWWVFD